MAVSFTTEFTLQREPRVPLRLRQSIDSRLDYCRAVSIVRFYEAERKQDTINRIGVTESDGARPKESTDEIAQAVANVMQHVALEAQADDEVVDLAEGFTFLIRFHYFQDRAKKSFKWVWKLDVDDEDELDEREIMSLTNPDLDEGSHVYLHAVIRSVMDQVERTQLAKERCENRLLEMAERTQKPMEMIDRQAQYSHGILMQGMQAMVNALELRYDHDKAQAAEVAKAERWDKMLGTLAQTVGPAAKIGLQQVATYLGNKANQRRERVPRADHFRGGEPSAPPEPQPEAPEAQPETPPEEPAPTDAPYEIVAAFGESLRPSQRKMIRKKLTPKTLDLFDDLLESENGAEVRIRYAAVAKHLGGNLAPLLEVVGELDEPQQQVAMALVAMMSDADEADED